MNKKQIHQKSIQCYITWLVFLFFVLVVAIMTMGASWREWVHTAIVSTFVVFTVATFHTNVTERWQGYTFVVCAMLDIFVVGVGLRDIYSTITMIFCAAIVSSVYLSERILALLVALSIAIILVHTHILHTVSFATAEDTIPFGVRIFCLFFSEIFLMLVVKMIQAMEEKLKISVQEARKAEQSKSDFLANMSHEIRTPMNAIVGMCELMLRENINDNVRDNCFSIQNSGKSLLAIINDILDYSKIGSGKAELIEEEFNIGTIVSDVLNMAVTRKGNKRLEIIARIDPNIPRGLIGDDVRIKQIMINLVTNAIKFTNLGCIVLAVSQKQHDYGINLNVSVTDTGIGITEENIEKLFTSFQQIDTRKNRSVEGTGLGLAISKQLVTRMGGFINVSSVYGEGTTFRFVIPLKVSNPEPFAVIRHKDKMKVALYLDMNKFAHSAHVKEYTKFIEELVEGFQVEFVAFGSLAELQLAIATGDYTHCFLSKPEYLEGETFFKSIADDVSVYVVLDKAHTIDLPKKMKIIYKPLSAISIARALNNADRLSEVGNRQEFMVRFTAPEAKVLIVDDNITNLKVAEGILKPYDMQIDTATSGKEAIQMLEQKRYDIILMDYMMPEMDGVETAHTIRRMKEEYYKKVPIIALTANAVNGVKEMFRREGITDFIAKPIELPSMDRVLRNWLPTTLLQIVPELPDVYVQAHDKMVKSDTFKELINIETGLVYAGNNQKTYLDNLAYYIKIGNEIDKASLNKYFATEDWKNYIINIHALKSTSRSIGAENLSKIARILEEAGKEGSYDLIKNNHSVFMMQYERVLNEVAVFLQENAYNGEVSIMEDAEIDDLTEITSEKLDEYMEALQRACEAFYDDEIINISTCLYAYSFRGKPLRPHFSRVKKLAEEFEYKQAWEMAESAVSKIKEAGI